MGNEKPVTPLWEKIVGALGLILLCSGFIYLTWVEVTTEKSPVNIVFNVDKITAVNTQFLVTVTVKNSSFQSATALQVEAALVKDGLQVETSSAQIDYIPSNSTRTVGFFFKQEPNSEALKFRTLGYQEP